MKIICGLILIAAAASVELTSLSGVTPVQKVLQLMESMLNTGKKQMHEEQVQFAAYKQFCDDTTAEKTQAIAEATETMEVLKADIFKYTAHAAKLTHEIAELDEDVSIWIGDTKAATKVREIEETDNHDTHRDYSESIDALERAIDTLSKEAYDRPQAESLLQVSNLKKMALIPDRAKHFLDAFLQAADQLQAASLQSAANAAPEANGYEFQSSGVVQMLSKLHEKFVAERTALEKKEANSHHAYELLMQDLETQIKQGEADRDHKARTKADALQAKAEALGDLQDLAKTQASDKKYLADMTATCEQQASEIQAQQQLRAEELEALEQAINIISSHTVAGSAEKHLPSLVQVHKKTRGFAQLKTELQNRVRSRAVAYLQSKSRELKSTILAALSDKVANDPFVKVRKMIKDLIIRLMEEANSEAEHKGWCDQELSTNEQTRREKTEAVETLHAEIDELEASGAKLSEEIAGLSHALSELDGAMAKATRLRQEDKAKNFETIKDAMDAQVAVEQAISILKEFYAKAGDPANFLQVHIHKSAAGAPDDSGITEEGQTNPAYVGQQDASQGVIGMLEVIESDFARLESETKAAEATDQKEYDEFIAESKIAKTEKSTMIEHKTAEAQDKRQELQEKTADLQGTQKELDASLAYFEKLRPSCVDAGVSYEDRVQRRREEIQSLQDALKILNGEDIA